MAVDDTWHLSKRVHGERVKSAKHGRGKRWRVRYNDDTGAPKERLFDRQADAEAFDAEVRTDVNRGQYVDPGLGKQTFHEFAEQWRTTQIHRATTTERVERALRLHIDPILGHRKLAEVRRSHIQAWVKDRTAVLAPSTLALVYGYLAAIFAAAVDDRAIGSSPCVNISLSEIIREDRFIPTPLQVYQLAEALPDWLSAQVWPGAGCGLRQGETWGLELPHIKMLKREIQVVQQLVTIRGQAPFLGPPKTKMSRRTVELGAVVAERIARHIEMFPPEPQPIEDRTDPRPAKWHMREATLVFVDTHGKPIVRGGTWQSVWKRTTERVGVPELTYHGLRHYYATLLIHAGASVKTVQLSLGHSKPSITLDMYTHEWPDALDRTRNLVDAALKDPRAQIGPNSVRLA